MSSDQAALAKAVRALREISNMAMQLNLLLPGSPDLALVNSMQIVEYATRIADELENIPPTDSYAVG